MTYASAAAKELKRIADMGMSDFPVCMAKTQYSLSDDQTKLGRPSGFTINVREVYVSAGAGFVVAITGANHEQCRDFRKTLLHMELMLTITV